MQQNNTNTQQVKPKVPNAGAAGAGAGAGVQVKKDVTGRDHSWTKDGKPICDYCKKIGHKYAQCRKRMAEQKEAREAIKQTQVKEPAPQ